MSEFEPRHQPTALRLPLAPGTDGHAYMGCDAVSALLRAIATTCRTLADEIDPEMIARVIDLEADALDCRAVALTRPCLTD
ncbi:hypothetical protein [Streptomyces abikoensis]|uniref:hypothetical protein n=1 Tax=Streptomyces abikoensis TaxID=97398 RepID=UPI00167197FD|nr:hypothetical protein [Streptomyces abikoensis]GGP55927.1 hypothetical protein GCM10010214_31400 [Streptomyces abikoensis]